MSYKWNFSAWKSDKIRTSILFSYATCQTHPENLYNDIGTCLCHTNAGLWKKIRQKPTQIFTKNLYGDIHTCLWLSKFNFSAPKCDKIVNRFFFTRSIQNLYWLSNTSQDNNACLCHQNAIGPVWTRPRVSSISKLIECYDWWPVTGHPAKSHNEDNLFLNLISKESVIVSAKWWSRIFYFVSRICQ